ncbi:EamA family transporter [Bacillus cereus]|uniref:EamA family transporter n=1 Tax=Bacillus cereus TaxID=1396 RepID=A0A9X7GUN8_BACCE|nr:DMT family transporter [Bacillus cereus]PGS77371.1 EamA family transporter [Bacillus cereus]
MKSGKIITSVIACLIACMSWGAMFPVADHALNFINPFYFSFIRYGIIAIVLVLLLWIKEGKGAFCLEGKGKLLIFFGIMGFTLYNLLVFLGQALMGKQGVMVASIMEALMPMVSICILWGYNHIKPKAYTIFNMAVSFVGAVFVITKGDMSFFMTLKDNIFPLAFIFIGVVGWVVYTMGGQTCSDWSTLRYSTLTCVFGTAIAGVITVIATVMGYITVPNIEIIFAVKYDLLFMITLPGMVALIAWNYGVKVLSSINGILFINFVPITTLAIMIIQGYQITIFDIAGTLLVITALIYNNICQRKQIYTKNIQENKFEKLVDN